MILTQSLNFCKRPLDVRRPIGRSSNRPSDREDPVLNDCPTLLYPWSELKFASAENTPRDRYNTVRTRNGHMDSDDTDILIHLTNAI